MMQTDCLLSYKYNLIDKDKDYNTFLTPDHMTYLCLQPENLMLLNHNSNRLKIIDFGLSRYLKGDEECRELLGTPEFVGQSEPMNALLLCILYHDQTYGHS